ncbi:hypothetical protein EDD52_11731 [Primorskyibacter sedentarius]|uniref:Uncharacterized protein n=1 Tax=Primorskyibacter sedentarius TaxID=745311 RepID=A0A4R3J284_9RHOB|nr:hypothetical protein EDD52_11731 [Primorskyibacter sedentarius]
MMPPASAGVSFTRDEYQPLDDRDEALRRNVRRVPRHRLLASPSVGSMVPEGPIALIVGLTRFR